MNDLTITSEEKRAGALLGDRLDLAAKALVDDGYVLFRGAVDVAHVDRLRERLLEDLERIRALPTLPENFTKGHLQQDPPPEEDLLFRDVVFNPFAAQVLRAVLGEGARLTAYTGNTNLPGTKPQPVHPDFYQLWPNLSMAHPGYGFVINVPLVDTSAHNGSTELWPGTHMDTAEGMYGGNIRVGEQDLARWRDKRPPFQPQTRKGDLLVRDCRLWHRGMPNHSDQPRPMVAMIVFASWYATGDQLVMPRACEAFFRDLPHGMAAAVRYTEDAIDHIGRLHAFDVRPDEAAAERGMAGTAR